MLHSISLPPGVYGGDEVVRLFSNTLDWDSHPYFDTIRGIEVSAHFFVRRDGALWQFVSVDDRAWHAGVSTFKGRDNCNDFSIGIELEGVEDDLFEHAQYECLGAVCTAIASRQDVRGVVGHEHVAPGRKRDPGAGFDWARLARSTTWPREAFPTR